MSELAVDSWDSRLCVDKARLSFNALGFFQKDGSSLRGSVPAAAEKAKTPQTLPAAAYLYCSSCGKVVDH
jgi:hypothetical protein